MTLRFHFLFITLLVLAFATLEPASAQTPSLTSSVAPAARFSLGPGQETTFTWTVVAAGAQATSVQVTPRLAVPSGWMATADLAPFTLGGPNGQASRQIPVRISLPPDAANVSAGELKLQATGTSPAGTTQAPDQTVFLTYVAPIIPPAPVPPDYTVLIVSVAVASLLLLGLAIYFIQARRIGLVVDHPVKRFNIGTGGTYKITVLNPRKVPQNVQLRIRGLPREWSAAFSFPVVPLNGGERAVVPLWVNVPLEASPNLHQAFRIQARPNRISPWMVSRTLQVDTLDVTIERPTA